MGAGELLRPDAAAMAAFKTCGKVGLMPHAWHGGIGVLALAVAGSKLGGTGLEKVQMIQIHVALLGCGAAAFGICHGLPLRWFGEEVELRGGDPPFTWALTSV